MSINVEKEVVKNIPCMAYRNNEMNLDHTIVMIHGFSNDKYEPSKIALQLAELGYEVVCFDIDGHGERYKDLFKDLSSDADFGQMIYKLLQQTSEELRSLMDCIKTSKISLVGISFGANVVNMLLDDQSIDGSVSILGALSFTDLLIYNMEKQGLDDFTTQEEKDLLRFVQSIDPSLMAINHKALFINASKDDDIPAEYTRTIFDKKWASNPDYRYYEEEEYHYVSNTMILEVINFFKK